MVTYCNTLNSEYFKIHEFIIILQKVGGGERRSKKHSVHSIGYRVKRQSSARPMSSGARRGCPSPWRSELVPCSNRPSPCQRDFPPAGDSLPSGPMSKQSVAWREVWTGLKGGSGQDGDLRTEEPPKRLLNEWQLRSIVAILFYTQKTLGMSKKQCFLVLRRESRHEWGRVRSRKKWFQAPAWSLPQVLYTFVRLPWPVQRTSPVHPCPMSLFLQFLPRPLWCPTWGSKFTAFYLTLMLNRCFPQNNHTVKKAGSRGSIQPWAISHRGQHFPGSTRPLCGTQVTSFQGNFISSSQWSAHPGTFMGAPLITPKRPKYGRAGIRTSLPPQKKLTNQKIHGWVSMPRQNQKKLYHSG